MSTTSSGKNHRKRCEPPSTTSRTTNFGAAAASAADGCGGAREAVAGTTAEVRHAAWCAAAVPMALPPLPLKKISVTLAKVCVST